MAPCSSLLRGCSQQHELPCTLDLPYSGQNRESQVFTVSSLRCVDMKKGTWAGTTSATIFAFFQPSEPFVFSPATGTDILFCLHEIVLGSQHLQPGEF